MMDPQKLQDELSHMVLHAWVNVYLSRRYVRREIDTTTFSTQFQEQAARLRESAILLQAALEKMRAANEKLASRMAEHKAFFDKYKTVE